MVTTVARPVTPAHGAERRTNHALVVSSLRSMILSGLLQPGDRLRIEELAQQFGVSPMPVREALHQLAAEGTAVLDPYRGFSIAELSPDEAQDLYATRAARVTRRHTEQAAERVIHALTSAAEASA